MKRGSTADPKRRKKQSVAEREVIRAREEAARVKSELEQVMLQMREANERLRREHAGTLRTLSGIRHQHAVALEDRETTATELATIIRSSRPARVASGWLDTTIPFLAKVLNFSGIETFQISKSMTPLWDKGTSVSVAFFSPSTGENERGGE